MVCLGRVFCRSPGSGPAGPENFGYFPSLESSPPAGGIFPKNKTEVSPCGASFFPSDGKETKGSPGDAAEANSVRQ